jgi:hypothetical protein
LSPASSARWWGKLDRNTKMDLLIRAAKAGEVVDEAMARKLQQLRRFRNRVHIKTVEELEYASYKHGIANGMLNILEEFRLVARRWIETHAAPEFTEAVVTITPSATQFATEANYDFGPPADDFAPPADDDIPF